MFDCQVGKFDSVDEGSIIAYLLPQSSYWNRS